MSQTTIQHSVEDLVSPEQASRIAEMFRLIGDPTRTRILYLLLDRGEQYVASIAATVQASETTVSHALRLLRTAHVVTSRREGRHIAYSLADDHVRELLTMTRDHIDHQEHS
jgi:ArsR family transcriptional regulator, lead/cadmium/zinc/bismuth-responsive transcriptional repressor